MRTPRFPFPTVYVRREQTTIILNREAEHLLDAEFVAVVRATDGTVSFVPLAVPEGTLTVAPMRCGGAGSANAARLHIGAAGAGMVRGRHYRCLWAQESRRLVVDGMIANETTEA